MATSMQMACRHGNSRRLVQATLSHLIQKPQQQCCQTSTASLGLTATQQKLMRRKTEIKIPKKKKRDASSILRTLADVSGKDHHFAEYKSGLIADSFLIPNKATGLFFQESFQFGRETAQHFIQKFPECFVVDKSAPQVSAYEPKKIKCELIEMSDEAIQEKIRLKLVEEAMKMYQEIYGKGESVSMMTTEQLVEAVMYYNGSNPKSNAQTHPMYFQYKPQDVDNIQPSKRVMYFLENLPEKSARIYKAIILGYCKCGYMTQALSVFKEMKEEGFKCDLDTIHALLSPSPRPCETGRRRATQHKGDGPLHVQVALKLLKDMKTMEIAPTPTTFSLLLTGSGSFDGSASVCPAILSEMKTLGMKPSLGIFYALLRTNHRDFTNDAQRLWTVLKFIETEQITSTCEKDMAFFVQAMDFCNQLRNPKLAYMVDGLFQTLGERHYFETINQSRDYYRSFFGTIVYSGDVDQVMILYDRINPHKGTFYSAFELWKLIEKREAFHLLPRLFEDLFTNEKGLTSRINPVLVDSMWGIMAQVTGPTELLSRLSEIITQTHEWFASVRLMDKKYKSFPCIMNCSAFYETGIVIKLRNGDFHGAWYLFECMLADRNQMIGEQNFDLLKEECMERGDVDKLQMVLNYMRSQSHSKVDIFQKELDEYLSKNEQEHLSYT